MVRVPLLLPPGISQSVAVELYVKWGAFGAKKDSVISVIASCPSSLNQ